MPNIEWNKDTWDNFYKWDLKGEEWSQAWGSSEAQWFSSIYPRIHRFAHCENVLELACGYGRWTKFLKNYPTGKYRAIDLSAECIDYCKDHFKAANIDFFKNDGTSLDMVTDSKYDFIFSFDSLVHANSDVLDKYISQILELLSPTGVCFIHHTNFKSLLDSGEIIEGHFAFKHMRDQSTTAEIVKNIIESHDGKILCQEIIDWGGVDSLDCLSLFSRSDSSLDYSSQHIINNNFMQEAQVIQSVHHRYTFPSDK